MPATIELLGTSFVTTAPAATIAFSPMVIPGKIVAAAPIHAFLLITIGLHIKDFLLLGSVGWFL
jgi:hypothetical protein